MEPSKQFASLRAAVESMGDCRDKTDLLALFAMADKLWAQVDAFGRIVGSLKRLATVQRRELEQEQEWRKKWWPLMEHFDDMAKDGDKLRVVK